MFGNSTLEALMALEDEELEFLIVKRLFEENRKTRLFKWRHARIDWQEHLAKEQHTGNFNSQYHMEYPIFCVLVDILRPWITVDFQKSMNSTSGNIPIYPELVVATGHGRRIAQELGRHDWNVKKLG